MRRHPRPLPGLQPATRPVAGFRSPAGGPLSVLPPSPPSAWRFFGPLPRNGANKAPVSTVRRHRSQNVGHGRGFCFFVAAASPALWQPLRGMASCRRNFVRTPPRPRHRTVSSDPSASSGRLMLRRLGSCLVIATRRLLPGEGVGSACLRLLRFRRGGVPCRDLSRLRLRPPSPTPGERSS